MTFEQKVRSMSAKEIIMAMVDSLTHPPIINIDMGTYGDIKYKKRDDFWGKLGFKKKVCFGCAATNTICQISGITLTHKNIYDVDKRANAIDSDDNFLSRFEAAINGLRCGDINVYNYYVRTIKVAKIKYDDSYLPILKSNYTNKDLEFYKELAEAQD